MGRTHATRRPVARAAAAAALAVAGMLTGCGRGSDAAAVSDLVVTAGVDGGYEYDVPERVPAGLTRVSLVNDGEEPHHAQLLRLDDGATVDDLEAALAAGGPPAALSVGTFEGGTGLVDPGETSRADAVVDLGEGTWVLICFVEGPDGAPHVAHGMLRAFDVDGDGGGSGTPGSTDPPAADAEVALVDYGVDAPDSLPGHALLDVSNSSAAEPHELLVARLEGDATAGDVIDAIEAGDRPPARAVGGLQAILPGASQRLQLDLEPGRYVLLCAVPSPDGVAHHAKGMVREVEVT